MSISNHRFILRIIPLIIVSTALIFPSCAKKYVANDAEAFFLKSSEGQSGIIDTPSFIFSPPPKVLNKAWSATGVVALRPNGSFRGGTSNGIYVRKKSNGRTYILTTKHSIYDVKTLKRHDTEGVFVREFSNMESDYKSGKTLKLELNKLPQKLKYFSKRDDYIFIPVAELNTSALSDAQAFEFDDTAIAIQELQVAPKLFTPKNLYSVSIKKGKDQNGNTVIYKFYQTGFFVTTSTVSKQINPYDSKLVTDMDVLTGLSGSPILHVSGSSVDLVGIVVSRTKKKNCDRFTELLCRNSVLLING